MRSKAFWFVGLLAIPSLGAGLVRAGEVSFEQRVRAQAAIERVYWSHRLWPKENASPRPSFEASVPAEYLKARVRDSLAKSAALEALWDRPITSRDLQVEIDRMGRDTRDAATLRGLFGALGHDARLVAETLARQTLVDRLLPNLYAYDPRFHAELRSQAEASLAHCSSVECLQREGSLEETTWRVSEDSAPSSASVLLLSPSEWQTHVEELARIFSSSPGALPLGVPSALQEGPDAFFVTIVLGRKADEVTIGTRVWEKLPFDTWWAGQRARLAHRFLSLEDPGFSLPHVSEIECTPDSWSASGVPDGRYGHTAVWTGAEMIVWGGSGNTSGRDGGRYDPATDSWRGVSQGTGVPQGRAFHAAVWTGAEMIVWGGLTSAAEVGEVLLNSGGRYDPVTDTWTATSSGPGVPEGRRLHVGVWTGTKMIVWGGRNSVGSLETWVSSGGRYDPASDTWEPTSLADEPEPRTHPVAVWTGTELIVWGGQQPASPSAYLQSGGRYRPDTDSWRATPVGPTTPTGRWRASAVWTGTEMVVWGGSTQLGRTQTGARFDPATDTWTPTSVGTNVPSSRDWHTAVWTGEEMIVWGGFRTLGSPVMLNSGGRYDPVTDSWVPTSTGLNVPAARREHTAVWAGTEMIVWGGEGSTPNKLNSGARYRPESNTWAPMAVGAPSGRADHTAIWTGTEMIVWGGRDILIHHNSGGRYDPALDVWLPTFTGVGVPAGRSDHTAVWTGSDMIVWGGFDGSTYTSTGGRYNPALGSWSATSTATGVPGVRSHHTAVWTGSLMIVWGGTSPAAVNTGGRYDPATDTWAATSVGTGVPEPSTQHTAVWTGAEMIVWGGTPPMSGGGRYDPLSDSWQPLSTTGAPEGRFDHTAVWTGEAMIVWGGLGAGFVDFDSGGRYTPGSDAWTSTSTSSGVPAGRKRHTAIWTEAEMVVWGGSGNGNLDTGGKYDPTLDTWLSTSMEGLVPQARDRHTAVWTGKEMIVWGGGGYLQGLGRYCLAGCAAPTTYFLDSDGDLFGDPALSVEACDPPGGYVTDGSDCDDGDSHTHPGAPETKDGRDNQCSGAGFGVIDEITGQTGWNGASFHWVAQAGASGYEVVRAASPSFTSGCVSIGPVSGAELEDSAAPQPGSVFFYLVRSVMPPPPGSWGQDSSGGERSGGCLPE